MRHEWARAYCHMPGMGHDFTRGVPWASMGELWGLFDEWLESMEDEIVGFARERGSVRPADVAERFKISRKAARTLLRRLQRSGRVESQGYAARDAD